MTGMGLCQKPKEFAMMNVKQHLDNMYIGLVFTYWSKDSTKMGTAKQKALQQMQSFAQTIDAQNPVAHEIKSQVAILSKSVSKQIMTDKSSEMILNKKQTAQDAAPYRALKTNVPEKAPKKIPQQLDQETLMRLLTNQRFRDVA